MGLESEPDDLRASINKLPDSDLLRIVGEDRMEYRPEAIQYARDEMTRRSLSIPENAGPAITRSGAENGSTFELEKGMTFSGLSILSRILFGAVALYVAYGGFVESKNRHYSVALGVALLSAMFWSLAWDARARSSASEGSTTKEPRWPGRLVILAGCFTAAAAVLAFLELYHR
jgi:hypothetical protein